MASTRFKWLSAAVGALVIAGASSDQIAEQFLKEVEGESSLVAYRDGSGVWTNCRGNTHNVDPKRVMTRAECDKIDRRNLEEARRIVDRMVVVPMSEARRAAVISFGAYNLGPNKLAGSTFLRKLNAGDEEGVCAEIRRWVFDQGRDCRLTKGQRNGCYGQVVRREMEAELCDN